MTDRLQRFERSKDVHFQRIKAIDEIGDGATVWEVDAINEEGEERENLTLVPRIRYSSTNDMRYRYGEGVVDKYLLALAREREDARDELLAGINEERNEIEEKIGELSDELETLDSFYVRLTNL